MMTPRFDARIRPYLAEATKSWTGRSSAAMNRALDARAVLHSRLRKIFQPAWRDAGLSHLFQRLKWLHDHKNDDQDHEDRGRFVQDPVESSRPFICVFRESAHAAGEKAVQAGEAENQDELRLEPARLPISGEISERES